MPSTPSSPDGPNVRTHIAANIRRLREARNLSQEELGELAQCHRTYVSQLERGITNISVDRLERLAQVLQVEVTDLMRPPDAQN